MYNSDPAIVGKPIRFAEVATTIAGVAPRDFDTPHGGDFWFSQQLDQDDINHFFEGFMRLKPGVTLERADAEMAPIMEGLARDFPASNLNRIYVTKPLVTAVVGDLGPILIIVMSATSLLLLLACVNVTNLLLARGAARAREMAVASPSAAGRGRIIRPAAHRVGAAVRRRGGASARCSRTAACARCSPGRVETAAPRRRHVRRTRLAFALAALVVSGPLVGFAPALRLAGTDVRTLMNESTPVDQRRPRHRALAECDDGRRNCPGDHARRRRRMAGARLRQPPEHRARIRRREAAAIRRVVPGPEVSKRRRCPRRRRAF